MDFIYRDSLFASSLKYMVVSFGVPHFIILWKDKKFSVIYFVNA